MLLDPLQHLGRRRTAGPARRRSPPPPPRPRSAASTRSASSCARSEYGATVVLAALFWLQSMKILPGRTALAIFAVIEPGTIAASSSATRLAYPETTSASCVPEIGQQSCMPFFPEVFGYAAIPSAASRSRISTATAQHSCSPAGAPGSRSTTSRSGSAPIRHCGVCSSSAARLASQTSVARSSTTTKSIVSRALVDPGTGSVSRRTQAGVPPGCVLLEEVRAVDAVGIADPGQRPVRAGAAAAPARSGCSSR